MSRPGVVVIGYRRADSLQVVLESIPKNGVSDLLVALDGPRGDQDVEDFLSVRAVAHSMLDRWKGRGQLYVQKSNVGSAVNVLSSVSLSLRRNPSTIVLEDDCIPSTDFWSFTSAMLQRYESDRNILCVCGSQLATGVARDCSHLVSDHPLLWGWATWRSKWCDVVRLLSSYLVSERVPRLASASPSERAYWRSGYRRSCGGFVDAWDIPLQAIMLEHGYKAVLPTSNLVTNTGNDGRATHVSVDSPWTGIPTAFWNRLGRDPHARDNAEVTKWLQDHVYRIRRRHVISTALSHVLDLMGLRRRTRHQLRDRLAL